MEAVKLIEPDLQVGLAALLPRGARLEPHWENRNSAGEERGEEEVTRAYLALLSDQDHAYHQSGMVEFQPPDYNKLICERSVIDVNAGYFRR